MSVEWEYTSDPSEGSLTHAELQAATDSPEKYFNEYGTPYHEHIDRQGIVHRCWHSCTNLLTNWQFWAGLTLGFPIEHALWEKVWPLYLVTQWLGL